MKVAVAQTKSTPGDLPTNLLQHLQCIDLACNHQVDLLVFPELSLTGYEPQLAKSLALTPEDARFTPLQQAANQSHICIAVGAPLLAPEGIHIALLIFRPQCKPLVYTKQHLYTDEERYFIPGRHLGFFEYKAERIAPSICYELSVKAHRKEAIAAGASIYMSSVAKTEKDMQRTDRVLSSLAAQHMVVLMANCTGPADSFTGCGQSSIWDTSGSLVGRMDQSTEGILIYDNGTAQTQILSVGSGENN